MKITITKTWNFELDGTKAIVKQEALRLTESKQPEIKIKVEEK